jgi:hypothetical protein
MQSIYPVVSETVLPLNDDLEIRYSLFIDGASYDRPAGSYRIWEALPFVDPVANETLAEACRAGIQWGCYEHVSVVIGGSAEYAFTKPNGTFIQPWSYGSHNVDNGFGYLPTDDFSRAFGTGFELCCIIQRIFHRKEGSYRFEVLTSTKVLDADALFVHHCTGIRKTETEWNLAAGQTIEVEAPDIAIVGYQI